MNAHYYDPEEIKIKTVNKMEADNRDGYYCIQDRNHYLQHKLKTN
jgi:hypothetical protein